MYPPHRLRKTRLSPRPAGVRGHSSRKGPQGYLQFIDRQHSVCLLTVIIVDQMNKCPVLCVISFHADAFVSALRRDTASGPPASAHFEAEDWDESSDCAYAIRQNRFPVPWYGLLFVFRSQ